MQKLNKLVLSILLLSHLLVLAQIKKTNKISWQKLEWTNFKKVVDSSLYDKLAESTCGIEVIYYETEFMLDSMTAYSYFNENESWTLTSSTTALEHEQLHFDICELFTRKIIRQFNYLKKNKVGSSSIKKTVNKMVDSAIIYLQNKYDSETDYGRNLKLQKKWKLYLKSELVKFESIQRTYPSSQ